MVNDESKLVTVKNQYGYVVGVDEGVHLWIKQLQSWYWTADNPNTGIKLDSTIHSDWTQSLLNLTGASNCEEMGRDHHPLMRTSSSRLSCVSSEGVLPSIVPDRIIMDKTRRIPAMEHRPFRVNVKKSESSIWDVDPPKKTTKWPTQPWKIAFDPRFHVVHPKSKAEVKVDKWLVEFFKNPTKVRLLQGLMTQMLNKKYKKEDRKLPI